MQTSYLNRTSQQRNQVISLNLWFIRLRWIACIVAFVLVILTIEVFHYLDTRTFWPLISLISLLAGANLIFTLMAKRRIFIKHLKEIQIVSDLVILTVMLHFSGGIENPLSFVYIFHVILSGILLDKPKCYKVVALSFLLYVSLALIELSGVMPHYTLQIFPHTATEFAENSHDEHHGNSNAGSYDMYDPGHEFIHAAHHPLYVFSMIFLMFFIMVLTAYFITNIMDRLRVEEKRTHDEHQRLEHVLQATNAGLLILNKNLKPIWYNEPVKTWLHFKIEDTYQQAEIIDNWIGGNEGPAALTLNDGVIRSIERGQVEELGQKKFFQVTVAPLTESNGKINQVVELIQDITNKKLLETEMVHAAKMVSLGTMAAGITHEVGNPLASISTRLRLLETQQDKPFISQSIKLLQHEISRIEQIVRSISQFGRPSKDGWRLCQINQIIKETLEILRYSKKAKVCMIENNLTENLPETLGVRDQLKQVFLNIGLNALEATPEGGTLEINAFVSRGKLEIEFIDSGAGILADKQEKIFNPFFTTKEKGMGLGLFIVNHIVQAHSGEINVKSNFGRGTKFTVILPIYRWHKSQNKRD